MLPASSLASPGRACAGIPTSHPAYESKNSKYAARHIVSSRSLTLTNADGGESPATTTHLSKHDHIVSDYIECAYAPQALFTKYCTTGIALIAKPLVSSNYQRGDSAYQTPRSNHAPRVLYCVDIDQVSRFLWVFLLALFQDVRSRIPQGIEAVFEDIWMTTNPDDPWAMARTR